MAAVQPISLEGTFGIFDVPKKVTVIRLRWLLVIICSYLLVSSKEIWFGASSVNGFIAFYLLTNFALYFVDENLFDSSYFYSPLVLFDTFIVTAGLVISGQVETDFYLAYFLIVILSTVWQDFRGLLVIAVLATFLYGYFLFRAGEIHDPSMYLRVPFLFVISLFYGYFVQVVRAEKSLKEKAEQEAQDMAMIQTLSQSLPSSLDYNQILETVGEKIQNIVHPARLYIFIVDKGQDSTRGVIFGGDLVSQEVDLHHYPVVQECLSKQNPAILHNVSPKLFSAGAPGDSKVFPYPTVMAVPITFRAEVHGVFLMCFLEENRVLSSREVQFCQIVAFATAIALSNANKYEGLQAEAKRRQIIAEQLAEANRLKSEFLANTTHELRTPIAAVVGYGDLLMEGAFGSLSEEQRSAMGRMVENARGLLGLVEEVLDYAKLERGQTALFMKRQEIAPLIEEIRQEVGRFEAGKPYRVEYEIGDNIPPFETDWNKLKRVLLNLLSNAVKFTDRGQVKLSVKKRSPGEIAFTVSDTGIGIPKDQIPLIFEKFRQLDGSSSRRYGGAGLGLTVSKNLVDLLGGRVEVESEPGKGSTFKLILPLAVHGASVGTSLGTSSGYSGLS